MASCSRSSLARRRASLCSSSRSRRFRVSTSPTRSSNDVLSRPAMSLNDCARAPSSSSRLPGTRALRSPRAIDCVARAMRRSGAVTIDASAAASMSESTSASGEDHRRPAAARAHARQIERFRHGRDQHPVTARCRRRDTSSRRSATFPATAASRSRDRTGTPSPLPTWPTKPCAAPELRPHSAPPSRRRAADEAIDRAGLVEDEGATVRADGLASQQQTTSCARALGVDRRRRPSPGSRPAACAGSPTPPDEAWSPASPRHRPRSAARQSPWRRPSRAPAR